MKVQLRENQSSRKPDQTIALAAKGDQADRSYVTDRKSEYLLRGIDTEEFIHDLLRKGHFGPFEHAQAFFTVEDISRVAMAQITRHRQMSFDVQSQRAVDFSDKDAVVPPSFEEYGMENKGIEEPIWAALNMHWRRSLMLYNRAIGQGVPKEDARFFLPQATPVNLTFSANARSLMHFLDMRKSGAAQWEAQEFATQVLEEAKEWAPLTFEGYEEYVNNNSLRAP